MNNNLILTTTSSIILLWLGVGAGVIMSCDEGHKRRRVTFKQDETVSLGERVTNKSTIPDRCMRGYELKNFLAAGYYGSVYQACKPESNCNYVMKFQEAQPSFYRELEISNQLSEIGIGPKFIGGWVCEDNQVGILVTEKWDGSMEEGDFKNLRQDLVDKLYDQINTMHDIGLIHSDITVNNVLVKRNRVGRVVTDVTLNDFGLTRTEKDMKPEFLDGEDDIDNDKIRWLSNLYKYHSKYPFNKDHYKESNTTLDDVIDDPKLIDYGFIKYLLKKRGKKKRANPNYQLATTEKLSFTPTPPSKRAKKSKYKLATTEKLSFTPTPSSKTPVFDQDVKITLGEYDDEILFPETCMEGYELRNFLAQGSYGSVYQACKPQDNCNYVIKFQHLINDRDDEETFEQEVKMSKAMSSIGVGPKLIGAYACEENGTGMIVSEKWDGQLQDDDLLNLTPEMVSKLENEINNIHGAGYVHADIKAQNVLVRRNEQGKVIDMTLTDFGLTELQTSLMKRPNWIDTLYEYHNGMPPNSFYYSENNISNQDVRRDPKLLDMGLIDFLKKRVSGQKGIKRKSHS